MAYRSGLLRLFAQDLLTCVLHTLALIGFGAAVGADIRRYLTDFLLVHALHQNFGLGWRLNRDAVGHWEIDRVREPKREAQNRALGLSAIAHPDDFQLLLEPFCNSFDHIGE